MNLYFEDLMKIIARLQQKKKERGFLNRDIDLKFKKIKQRLERIKRGHRAVALGEEVRKNATEAAKEELRRFVFEEFIKKDPD